MLNVSYPLLSIVNTDTASARTSTFLLDRRLVNEGHFPIVTVNWPSAIAYSFQGPYTWLGYDPKPYFKSFVFIDISYVKVGVRISVLVYTCKNCKTPFYSLNDDSSFDIQLKLLKHENYNIGCRSGGSASHFFSIYTLVSIFIKSS